MKADWPLTTLGEILTERQQKPSIDAILAGEVPIVSKIGFYDGTIELRDNFNTKTGMIQIEPGDLVLSGINAAKGAIAIYDEVNPGPMAATIHYSSYIPNKEKVDISYLWWFFRSNEFREILNRNVPGGIKTELKAKRLLPIPIHLPPLSEQRRIVAKIEQLATKIKEAKILREDASVEAELLSRNFSKVLFGQENKEKARLCDLTSRITKGESPGWQGFSYQESGPIFVRSENVLWGEINLEGCRRISQEFHDKLCRSQLMENDVLINLVGASIGRACVAPEGIGPANVNQAVAVITPLPERLDSQYLLRFLLSTPTQDILHGGKVETARPNISLRDLKKLQISVPPLDDQKHIVEYLDDLQAKADSLKKLQEQTADDIDDFLPSTLDKAFKGELISTKADEQARATTPYKDDAAVVCLLLSEMEKFQRPTTEFFIQKHIFSAKHHLHLPINSTFHRKVAGPWSHELKRKAIHAAIKTNWLSWNKQGNLVCGPSFNKGLNHAAFVLGESAAQLVQLVKDLKAFGTNGLERWTTVLKVVEDLKETQQPITRANIQHEIDTWPGKRLKEIFVEESVDYTINKMIKYKWLPTTAGQ